jgi:hypothetical protein
MLIGSDPEVFVTKDNEVIPVCGLIGGDKGKPVELLEGGVLEDNVLAEFNITPCSTSTEFITRHEMVMEQVKQRYNLSFSKKASYTFPEYQLNQYPQALEFGCGSDYNALSGIVNPKPSPANGGFRTAGGHLHIGWSDEGTVTRMQQRKVGVLCDYFLGLPSVLLDSDTDRRQLYGKAGAIRYKEYGIEYRTLSNFWLFNITHMDWAFNQATKAYKSLDKFEEIISKINPDLVQQAINESDVALAESLLEQLKEVA